MTITFDLPPSFGYSDIPENFKAKNEEFIIGIDYQKSSPQMLYNWHFQVPKAMISQSNQQTWNKTIKELKENYNQPVIFKKKP